MFHTSTQDAQDAEGRRRARVWRSLTPSPPTFVPAAGDGALAAPPSRAQLRRRAALSPAARPARIRGEWLVGLAGLGYHMSLNSDRLMCVDLYDFIRFYQSSQSSQSSLMFSACL